MFYKLKIIIFVIMEIELTTTKKKLTKAIVNQMPFKYPVTFEDKCLGYLLNVRNKCEKVYLFLDEKNNPYLMGSWLYLISEDTVSYGINKRIEFENKTERDIWWNKYKLLNETTKQIYI